MDPEQAVIEALKKWRRLSLAQTQGIRTRRWGAVAECQFGIEQLRSQLDRFYPPLRQKWQCQDLQGQGVPEALRSVGREILQIERQNQALIARQRELLREKQVQLDSTSLNLRRIQQSYAPDLPAAWSSFS